VDRSSFEALPRGFWGRLIRFAMRRVRGDLRGLERTHLQAIEDLLARGVNTDEISVPGEVRAYAHQGSLYLFPGELPAAPTGAGQPTAAGPGRWRVRFAALGAIAEIESRRPDLISQLEVRSRRSGDRLMDSSRKLKEVLSAGKVPRPYRDFVPVLARDDEIVSCPALMPSRSDQLQVRWLLEDRAPFLDIDFPILSSAQ
jgi:tRNA(Ile)-lysidine synthetase-like protein